MKEIEREKAMCILILEKKEEDHCSKITTKSERGLLLNIIIAEIINNTQLF